MARCLDRLWFFCGTSIQAEVPAAKLYSNESSVNDSSNCLVTQLYMVLMRFHRATAPHLL